MSGSLCLACIGSGAKEAKDINFIIHVSKLCGTDFIRQELNHMVGKGRLYIREKK